MKAFVTTIYANQSNSTKKNQNNNKSSCFSCRSISFYTILHSLIVIPAKVLCFCFLLLLLVLLVFVVLFHHRISISNLFTTPSKKNLSSVLFCCLFILIIEIIECMEKRIRFRSFFGHINSIQFLSQQKKKMEKSFVFYEMLNLISRDCNCFMFQVLKSRVVS